MLRGIPIDPTVTVALILSGVVIAFYLAVGAALFRKSVSKADPNEVLR